MKQHFGMKATQEQYQDLINKLNALHPVIEEDRQIEDLLQQFIKAGSSLATEAAQLPTLDEHGRSYTVGSRKTARAQVWMVEGDGQIYVNGRHMSEYFPQLLGREEIVKPFEVAGKLGQYNVWALVQDSGKTAQARAVAVGVARGLAVHCPELRELLRRHGLTKIDTRQVERKKTGKLKARKSPTWRKR
ncbi:37S ribosomal protein S9, mitochondrial [Rhizophlyctis rosea]|nr:37S ribosomal protein S9, mitochondrial [Rhizophlyctis rosea]